EHRGHEQVELREVPGVAGVAAHVADRVDVDQEAHAGDHQAHDQAELVDEERDVHRQAAGAQELPDHVPVALGAGRVGDEADEGEHEADTHGGGGDDPAGRLAQPAAEQADHQGADQRDERRQGDELDEDRRLGHARTSASSSTSVVTRYRKIATRMPRPTATSAAATASTMNTAP